MENPIYDLQFEVDRKGPSVSPTDVQRAGYFGDNLSARVTFTVKDPLADRMYRIEIVDGNGAYDATELLFEVGGTVSYDIPSKWTAAGTATLRLLELETENGMLLPKSTFSYPPVKLLFESREDGPSGVDVKATWQELMAATERALSVLGYFEGVGGIQADEIGEDDEIPDMPEGVSIQLLYGAGTGANDVFVETELSEDTKNSTSPIATKAVADALDGLITCGEGEPDENTTGTLYIQLIPEVNTEAEE